MTPDATTLLQLTQGDKRVSYFVTKGTDLEVVTIGFGGRAVRIPRVMLDMCLAELDKDIAA